MGLIIFRANFLGLSPNLVSFTVAPIFILGVALPLFLAPILRKIFLSVSQFIAHFLPLGSPLSLGPFLVLIEIIRVLILKDISINSQKDVVDFLNAFMFPFHKTKPLNLLANGYVKLESNLNMFLSKNLLQLLGF